MAGRNQKLFYIEESDLREKYHTKEHVTAMCKAIGKSTHSQIDVRFMPRGGSIRFEVIGNRIGTTKDHILKEMCQPKKLPKHGVKVGAFGGIQPTRSSQRAQQIMSEEAQDKILKDGIEQRYLLTEAALAKHNLLTGASELREFACEPCDFYWWKVVLITKPVSTCEKCRVKYDCLPRDKEFGIGRYICQNETCKQHTFYLRCQATQAANCWSCCSLVYKPYIHPKFRRTRWSVTPSSPGYHVPIKKVINPSIPHDSTGSTIDTFLTQIVASDLYAQAVPDLDSDSDGETFIPDDSDSSSEVDTPSQSEYESEMEVRSESSILPSDSDSDIVGRHRRRTVGTDSSDSESSSDSSTGDDESSSDTGSDKLSSQASTTLDSGLGTVCNVETRNS